MPICSTPELDKLLEQLPEPKSVFKYLLNVTQVPRGSNPDQTNINNSLKIIEALTSWAKALGYAPYVDTGHNIVIRKPASSGKEDKPTVCLQCHMDMVCSADEGVLIDFKTQPITPYISAEGHVRAKGTSLGADNGIGIGTVFAILEDKNLIHGPLEILITRDEETGLFGAAALEENILKCKYLINIDSEEEAKVCIGCAGGFTYKMTKPLIRGSCCSACFCAVVTLKGLNGGHSGVNIDMGRLNALSMIGRLLAAVPEVQYHIISINGGTAHNSIPRDCIAKVMVPSAHWDEFTTGLQKEFDNIKLEYVKIDPEMTMSVEQTREKCFPLSDADTQKLVKFLNTITNGPLRWSPDVHGLVESSHTLGIIEITDSKLMMTGSCRSSVDTQLDWMYTWLQSFCSFTGYTLSEKIGAYPGWKPDPECELTKVLEEETTKAYGKPAVIYAIHAGLECGLFMGKYKGIQCSSIGPELQFPHTPSERLFIKSVLPYYKSLINALAKLAA